jgi:hypothetical protein
MLPIHLHHLQRIAAEHGWSGREEEGGLAMVDDDHPPEHWTRDGAGNRGRGRGGAKEKAVNLEMDFPALESAPRPAAGAADGTTVGGDGRGRGKGKGKGGKGKGGGGGAIVEGGEVPEVRLKREAMQEQRRQAALMSRQELIRQAVVEAMLDGLPLEEGTGSSTSSGGDGWVKPDEVVATFGYIVNRGVRPRPSGGWRKAATEGGGGGAAVEEEAAVVEEVQWAEIKEAMKEVAAFSTHPTMGQVR